MMDEELETKFKPGKYLVRHFGVVKQVTIKKVTATSYKFSYTGALLDGWCEHHEFEQENILVERIEDEDEQ